MTASMETPAAAPRPSVSDWLSLRRHPLPEFWNALDRLPPAVAAAAEGAFLPGDQFAGALIAPAEYVARRMVHWEYTPERALVFLKDALLHITMGAGDVPTRIQRFEAPALLSIRSSIILLSGVLELEADCGGAAGRARLEYNTVVWEALNKALLSFLAAACPVVPPPADPAADLADAKAANETLLRTLPFKFASGLRYYSLSPGERVRAAVFQPGIWRRKGPPVPRQVTPNTLLAVTDRKLVLIEENRTRSWWRPAQEQGEYGWIFTFVPRDRVLEMTVTPEDALAGLTIDTEWGARRETRRLTLEPAVAARWQEAWAAAG